MKTEINEVIEFETPAYTFEIVEPQTDSPDFVCDRDLGDEDAHDLFEV